MKSAAIAALAATTALVLASSAIAQDKTLYVAAYGGSYEQTMRQEVIPAFEQANPGVKIEYVAGNSTDTLAKLQAQRGNQQIDVAIVDDGPAYQAVALGFCAELEPAAIYDNVAPVMKYASNRAVGLGLVATGLFYNTKAFEENGWAAPTSWTDLESDTYGKRIVVPPINNTYGLHALIAMAELGGGGVDNIDPGFDAFINRINQNIIAYEPSPAKMTELFQNGEAVLGVWGSGRVKAFADTGFPVAFVYPKEGGYPLGVGACPIEGSKNAAEANAFIQFMLTPDIQKVMAKGAGFGPANVTVTLTEEEREGLPYGDELASLKPVDWDTVNQHREEWTKRWNREVER